MHVNISKEAFFNRGGLLDEILNNTFEQAMLVDINANIIFFSKGSERFSKKKSSETLGHPINEFVPNHGFDKVLKTGIADKGVLVNLEGNITSISHHIPVFAQGELIGAIGFVVFTSLDSVKKLLASLISSGNSEYSALYDRVSRLNSKYSFNDYIGEHPLVKQLIEQAQVAAESNLPILICGETGTGKEIIANAIHTSSNNTFLNPFVTVNCSAIPDHLLESEMFGHEKGSFTGAATTRKGKFELAGKGSILLDEIGDMNSLLQTKLLRVLEEKEFERVGGTQLIPSNARIIASTNADLPRLCADKKFRSDLYYRLNTLELYIPPLRQRFSDIPLLIGHFISNSQYDIKFNDDALDIMLNYHWPGNVRQLRNIVNRFGVLKKGHVITEKDVKEVFHYNSSNIVEMSVPSTLSPSYLPKRQHTSNYGSLKDLEISAIKNILKECRNNQTLAAQKLGISRSTLIRKIKTYDINI